jgi:hypothetical protein
LGEFSLTHLVTLTRWLMDNVTIWRKSWLTGDAIARLQFMTLLSPKLFAKGFEKFYFCWRKTEPKIFRRIFFSNFFPEIITLTPLVLNECWYNGDHCYKQEPLTRVI